MKKCSRGFKKLLNWGRNWCIKKDLNIVSVMWYKIGRLLTLHIQHKLQISKLLANIYSHEYSAENVNRTVSTSECSLSGWVARLFEYVRHQFAAGRGVCGLRFFNVCFHWLDVTAADSRPVHLPQAECQGIMRRLVVKFRIWQNVLKPGRLQMQREQPGQSDDFPFPTKCIIFPFACSFACSQTNHQIAQRLCHCLDTASYCLSY